jgi:hypothetical protein
MRFTLYLRLFVVTVALCVVATHAGDTHCDCTKWPFNPDPPCPEVCIPKHLAIASADDLKNVFGLPNDVATMIGGIPPNDRPRSLQEYKHLMPQPVYQALEKRIASLGAADFERVRRDAIRYGITLDKLQW